MRSLLPTGEGEGEGRYPSGIVLKGYRVPYSLVSILLISCLAGCTAAQTAATPTLPPVATASPTRALPSPTVAVPTVTPIAPTPSVAPTVPPTPTIVPATPGATRTPVASPVTPSPTNWTSFTSAIYGLTLRYPANWTRDPRYNAPNDERFGGRDGFFQVSAMAATSVDVAANLEANHVLQPYGSTPTITPLQLQRQPARLILPSSDQVPEMNGQAALIVRSPRSIRAGTNEYGFVVVWADKGHLQAIADTLRFGS